MSEKTNKILHIISLVIFILFVLLRITTLDRHVTVIGFIIIILSVALLIPPSWIKFYPDNKLFKNIFIKLPVAIILIVVAFGYFIYYNPSVYVKILGTEYGYIEEGQPYSDFVKKQDSTMEITSSFGKINNLKINDEVIKLDSKGQTSIYLKPGKNIFKVQWEAIRDADKEIIKGEKSLECYYKTPAMLAKEAAEEAKAEREEYLRTHPQATNMSKNTNDGLSCEEKRSRCVDDCFNKYGWGSPRANSCVDQVCDTERSRCFAGY